MTDDLHDRRKPLLDPQGRPARRSAEPPRCPQCQQPSPPGDPTKRTRSSGFGGDVHDVCTSCGYDFKGELTV
jgi:hypothetical protein